MTGFTRFFKFANFAGFQAGWWACALGARDQRPYGPLVMGVFVLLHLLSPMTARRRLGELLLLLAAGLIGVISDGALLHAGVLGFAGGPRSLPPLWMVALWVGFAATLNGSLRGLAGRPFAAAALGALSGPLAYRAGESLGALQVPGGLGPVALEWTLAMVLLLGLAQQAAGDAPEWPRRLLRRSATVPGVALMLVLWTAALPLWVLVAVIIDEVRWRVGRAPRVALRMGLMAWAYFLCVVAGVLWLGVLGLASWVAPARQRPWTAALQAAWTTTLLRAAARIFALRFEVRGEEALRARPRPLLVLIRHSSVFDTLLPGMLLSYRHGLRLRYVLKRELLIEPCLDIAGNILPNHFVDRSSRDTAGEIAAVRRLSQGMDAGEAVLLYPEGTRFTPGKRARRLAALLQSDAEQHQLAESLEAVLPPRLGGVMALLEEPLDVLFFAHEGLEASARWQELWRGRLLRRTVRVGLWRVAREDIPPAGPERVRWLYGQWQRVDEFVRGG